MLNEAAIGNQESDSELQLDIECKSPSNSDTEFDIEPLSTKRTTTAQKRKTISPFKITPDELSVTFGDKVAVIEKSKSKVARKTIMRRAKEPRAHLSQCGK